MVHNAFSIQFCLFAGTLGSFWLIDNSLFGFGRAARLQHLGVNALFIVSAFPIQIALSLVYMDLAGWCSASRSGLIYYLPGADNPWIKYGLMFLLLDFLDYVYHYTMHRFAIFWRFHLVHHTDLTVDASTTVREHPGETVFRNGFLILWILLLGASPEILIIRQSVETLANIFQHTSLPLRPWMARILGLVFITPNLHHIHHHIELPYTNRNYGDVFSIWDRIFGTFIELPRKDVIFGLDTHLNPKLNTNYRRILAFPFSRTANAE
jgi:sterol desaturase/sphingolipid hydroxylase (fatty acid hydroxylase superfamily)